MQTSGEPELPDLLLIRSAALKNAQITYLSGKEGVTEMKPAGKPRGGSLAEKAIFHRT